MIDTANIKTKEIQKEWFKSYLLSKFENFVDYFFELRYGHKFKWNWHHHLMCSYVDKVVRGEIQYLVVNIPPRYSKTEIWSIFFPAYGFALNAASRFINVSYNQNLTLRNSAFVQDIIKLKEFQELFPKTVLKKRSTAKEEWENIKDGGYKAVSTGMGITGFGAGTIESGQFNGAIIIDDPLKPQDKESDITRPACIDYFKGTLLSRRNNEQVPIVIIMQRLHEEDLSGYCLSDDCHYDFHHLCLPAIAEDEETVLWNEKHTLSDLQLIRKEMGAEFAGQYEQRPAPAEGGILKDKYWQYFEGEPDLEYKIITIDTSEGEKETADYTCMQAWGKRLNRVYFLDQVKVRADSEEINPIADAFYGKHQPRVAYVEKANIGTGLINRWKKEGKPVIGVKQHRSKIERVNEILTYIQNGYVYLRKSAEWLSDFLSDCRNFPNAKHDDCVDCLSLAVKVLLAGEGFMLYDEFSIVRNVSDFCYKNIHPLLICFNTVNQPAYVFGQLTEWGQLRILDSDFSDDVQKEEIIRKCLTKQIINYPESQNKVRLYTYTEKKEFENPFSFDYFLKQEFGQSPKSSEIKAAKNDIIDLTARLLREVVINPLNGQEEKRLVIHPQNEMLIKAFEGGVTYEPKENDADRPERKLKEIYPYTNLINAVHQLIYEVFLAQKVEAGRKNKKQVSFKAHY